MAWLSLKTTQELAPQGLHNLQLSLHKSTMQEFDQGMDWYALASNQIELTRKSHFPWLTKEKFVGLVAIFSPNMSWESNIMAVKEFLLSQRVIATRQTTVAAKKWLNDSYEFSLKTAPKTANFFNNLLDPYSADHVTIDRHAIRAWLGPIHANMFSGDGNGRIGLNYKSYNIIASHYKEVAEHYEILPNQLQAITWLVARRQYGRKKFYQCW